MWVKIEPEWQGKSCHIIAGGPSIACNDLSKLQGKKTIAINKAGFVFPADILFFADLRFSQNPEFREKLLTFAGQVLTTCGTVGAKPFGQLRVLPVKLGIAPDNDAACVKFTSLQGALNIAVHKGCKKIVLHGADMKNAANGATHFHDGYPPSFTVVNGWEDRMINDLANCVEPLAALGVQVVNANPDSALPHWPKMSFEDALEWAEEAA